MSRLLLAAAVAAILLLVGAFVPVNGKTLVERWNGTPTATRAASKGVVGPGTAQPGPVASPKPVSEPVENHTDADRSAIDKIVAEHAVDRPAPRR